MRKLPTKRPIGKTNKILTILEPIIFPIARPVSCFSREIKETVSSGRDVPSATMVMPTIRGEMRSIFENFSESLTSFWVEKRRMKMPMMKLVAGMNIFLL